MVVDPKDDIGGEKPKVMLLIATICTQTMLMLEIFHGALSVHINVVVVAVVFMEWKSLLFTYKFYGL